MGSWAIDRGRSSAFSALAVAVALWAAIAVGSCAPASALGSRCDDRRPNGGHTCQQQKSWGKCNEGWFKSGGYCRMTCGVCSYASVGDVFTAIRFVAPKCGLSADRQAELEEVLSDLLNDDKGSVLDPQFATRNTGTTLAQAITSRAMLDWFTEMDVGCLVREAREEVSAMVVQTAVEKVTSPDAGASRRRVSKRMEQIFKPESAAQILVDFFKTGCTTEQWVTLVGPIIKALTTSANADVLLDIYSSEGKASGSGGTIHYTSEVDDHPSVSTCLGRHLGLLLTVRSCNGWHCFN